MLERGARGDAGSGREQGRRRLRQSFAREQPRQRDAEEGEAPDPDRERQHADERAERHAAAQPLRHSPQAVVEIHQASRYGSCASPR